MEQYSWTENIRNPAVYWVRLAMFAMLCLMIGTMYLRMSTASPQHIQVNAIKLLFACITHHLIDGLCQLLMTC